MHKTKHYVLLWYIQQNTMSCYDA